MHSPEQLRTEARRCIAEMNRCDCNPALKRRLADRAAEFSELANRLRPAIRRPARNPPGPGKGPECRHGAAGSRRG